MISKAEEISFFDFDFDNLNMADNANSKLEFLFYTVNLHINELVVDAHPLNLAESIINSNNQYRR
ncbi:MAG: hypothetical protein ABR595_02140 [Psychroflexus sp.]